MSSDGRLSTKTCLRSSLRTPTTRREFTGPRGEPKRKVNKEKRRRARPGEKGNSSTSAFRAASSPRNSSSDLASRFEARPARRLGPCFKISSQHFFAIPSLFFTSSIMALYTAHNPIFSVNYCVLLLL